MTDPIQPEELTELLDDDLEMWAAGGTRIMPNPRSEAKPQLTPSYPPVATSVPPPPAAIARSNAPIWAAVAGMTGVFLIAAIAGGVLLFTHRDRADAEVTSTVANATTTATVTTAEPEAVTLTPAITVTTTATAAPVTTAPAAPIVVAAPPKLGMVQTWAVGNGKPIYVDGKQVGVGGGRVKAVCGKHSVAVGTGRAKTYDIPCNGAAIVVGTPDGQ